MLNPNVHILYFVILCVHKLIYDKRSMYAVLSKDTIKNEILLHLSIAKCGFVAQYSLVEIVNAIFYKLKAGLTMAISSRRVTLQRLGIQIRCSSSPL